jgi:hypothetical protein
MHVKWDKYRSTGRLVASLSESHRVDGVVRSRHVGMLATLRPADPSYPTVAERAALWEQAHAHAPWTASRTAWDPARGLSWWRSYMPGCWASPRGTEGWDQSITRLAW